MRSAAIECFWAKVSPEPNSGCWIWIGAIRGNGYGGLTVKGKTWKAHRWSYTHFIGPIPEGLDVDHTCRVRSCVNPDHLRAMTNWENVKIGESFSARNAAKTHCSQGHEYSPENTKVRRRSKWHVMRECRKCKTLRGAARYPQNDWARAEIARLRLAALGQEESK